MHIYKSPQGELTDIYYGDIPTFLKTSPNLQADWSTKIIMRDSNSRDIFMTAENVFDFENRFAHILAAKYNIGRDDVVALATVNSVYLPSLHYSVLHLGGIISPSNVMFTTKEYTYQFKLVGARFVVLARHLESTVRPAAEALDLTMIFMEDLITEATALPAGFSVPDLVKYPGKDECKKKLAYLNLSSGTSGNPKAVMLTHHNLTSNVQMLMAVGSSILKPSNIYAGVIPMSHIYGIHMFIYSCIWTGGCVIFFGKFDFENLLAKTIEFKVSHLFLVPPIIVLCAKHPIVDKYADGIKKNLKLIFSGAAPLSGDLCMAAMARLGGRVKISQGYGLTETSPVSHFPQPDSPLNKLESIGWLVPGQDCRLVGEDGQDVSKPYTRGEIWYRGPNVCLGYFNNPQGNAESFEGEWFKTGDVAMCDEHERFYIVDRIKEMIKSNGHQVAPAELEALMLTNPDVADVAVIGVSRIELGTELPRAFIVLREPNIDPLSIKKWFDAQVSRPKKLWGGVVVMDAIPKSSAGKILRRFLRDRKGDRVYGDVVLGPAKL
ncbi:acetyl-CoA synthetase-like protein [Nadsonia fulvescens var. elongata DSM 6958]|uniref:Acetyl-CoA synthetase-like protein n=1 Tax=Nadsonia fulvescens var. elongata DSM 6958 TaxID=857566 RepID=A0A1E3PGY8_9ASCO|nr:acetyl-CoA synthetase-like protein [Nadsonia fulvescens var. elongata DSM 6958]